MPKNTGSVPGAEHAQRSICKIGLMLETSPFLITDIIASISSLRLLGLLQ